MTTSDKLLPESMLCGEIVGAGAIAVNGVDYCVATDGHAAAWIEGAAMADRGRWDSVREKVARWIKAECVEAPIHPGLIPALSAFVKPCWKCEDVGSYSCRDCTGPPDFSWEHYCDACGESHSSDCHCKESEGVLGCGCPTVSVKVGGHLFDGRKLLRGLRGLPKWTHMGFVPLADCSRHVLRFRGDGGGMLLIGLNYATGEEAPIELAPAFDTGDA